MASGEALVGKLRATPHGHDEGDFLRALEYYGFKLIRHARHGAIFRHPNLANHADASVRQLMIPKGRGLPAYVTRKVLRAIDALEAQNG